MGRPRKQPDPVNQAMEQIRYFGGEDVHYDSHGIRMSVNGLAKVLEQNRTDRAEIVRTRIEAARLAGEIAARHGDTTTAESFGQSADDLDVILEVLEAPRSDTSSEPAATTKENTGGAKSR